MPRGTPKVKRERTTKQLANDQRMREKAALERDFLRAADPEAVSETGQPEDLVLELANLFGAASQQRGLRARDIEDAERILSKMDPFKYPELADNPTVQRFIEQMNTRAQANADVPPGSLIGTGLGQQKKIWQHKDVLDRMLIWIYGPEDPAWPRRDPAFKPVTFIPMETITLTWQGLSVTVITREEATVPQCFYDLYTGHNLALVTGEQFAQFLFKKRDRLDPTKVDVSILDNPAAARVRGAGEGTYFPGAGSFEVGEDTAATA